MNNHRKFNMTLLVVVLLIVYSVNTIGQQPRENKLIGIERLIQEQENNSTSLQKSPQQANSVVVTTIMTTYTYPTGISSDGNYVVGSTFGGGASYFWSEPTGIVQIPGTVYGISDNGHTSGAYSNSVVQYNGSNVETAGICDPGTLIWTFLGMNPAVPQTFSTDYNNGWDLTADGNTVVGMQWYPGYNYSAFKWTQSGGYTMIGTGVGNGSRASGISANGATIYGWGEYPGASRTPVIWYNGQVFTINAAQYGEAYGASTTGNYVTGEINNQGFRWSPSGTVTFSNTLNIGTIAPTTVLNNGEIFGYTDTSWPPNPLMRRAFARDSLGVLMTFNDYAEARGLENAQQWTFYSINDASAEGNKLVGAGKTPDGQNITFIMEFVLAPAAITVSPQNVNFGDVQVGTQSPSRELVMKNSGSGNLLINSVALGGANVSQFQLTDNNSYPISLGYGDSAIVSVAFFPTSSGNKAADVDFSTNTGSFQVSLSGKGIPGVGITELKKKTITVTPNPAASFVTVNSLEEIEVVKMYNRIGQLVFEKPCKGLKSQIIDVTEFKPGLYFIFAVAANGSGLKVPVIISR